MMTLCLMPNLSGYKRLGDPKDLLGFSMKNFVPLNQMMERAGMSEMDIYNRTRDVFLHYKLPYNSEPPEG